MSVVALKTSKQTQANPKPVTRAMKRKLAKQTLAASFVGSVALTLTALSLTHQADGIKIITACPEWQAWSMAAGIDLGFIALEVAQLSCATVQVQRTINRFAKPAIIGTLAASAVMNAFAFASQATSLPMQVAAATLGVAVPALIYVLTRVAVDMAHNCTR